MNEPRLEHVACLDAAGLHRMAYWEWGERENPRVLVCVHGLTRQGRDFDTLARALAGHYRVICPDIAGRGHSDRLPNPQDYVVPRYVADMVTLLMVLVELALADQAFDADFNAHNVPQLLSQIVRRRITHFPRLCLLCFMLAGQTSHDPAHEFFIV